MDWSQFARLGAHVADCAAAQHRTPRDHPVRARTRPGEIAAAPPASPPETGT